MNPIALQLGPISIRWYAICIVTGVILAVYLSMKEAPRKRINPDHFDRLSTSHYWGSIVLCDL